MRKIVSSPGTAGFLSTLLFFVLALPGLTQEPFPDGVRVFTIGNSHTNSTMNPGLLDLVSAAGHPVDELDTVQIAGASLAWIRGTDSAWQYIQNNLGTKSWDVLTLQAYNANVESDSNAAIDFIGEALRNNPDVHVLLYPIWPKYPDRHDPPVGRAERNYMEPIMDEILSVYPDLNLSLMPISLIIRDLYEEIDAGRVPNVPEEGYLFRDGAHLGPYGAYIVNATAAALIHGESPVGYPGVSVYGSTVEPETAAVFQQVILDFLNTYPRAGFNSDPIIATRRLPSAVQGLSYSVQLEAVNVSGSESWELAPGSDPLPAGLSLGSDGLLSGTTSAAHATYPITVRMTDGAHTSERDYELQLDQDLPPSIVATTLPEIEHAKIKSVKLEAEHGVGLLQWELVSGSLPTGMFLLPSGFVTGVPGESGEFDFTVQVSDSHPDGAKTDMETLSLTVGQPDPETAFIRIHDLNITWEDDGKFDDLYWDFSDPRTIDKVIEGSPTATVEWDAFRAPNGFKIGMKIKDGALGKGSNDAIDIFFDGNNSDEVIYNTDDYHVRLSRGGGRDVVAGYIASFAVKHDVQETADGWHVEIEVGGLNGRGVIPVPGDFYACGFDIVVRQSNGSETHQIAWKGTMDNPHDTSGFGTICFEGEVTPVGYRDIYNGDFAINDYNATNKYNSDILDIYKWYFANSWRFVQDQGFIQDVPDSGNLGFGQLIETPLPGDYQLRFRYKAPQANSDFVVSIFGFHYDEELASGPRLRGDVDSPLAASSPYPEAQQFLSPQTIASTGDEEWHEAIVPFTIPEDAPRITIVNFVQEEKFVATNIEIGGPMDIVEVPTAGDDNATILKTDTPLIDVLANDAPGGALTIHSVQAPAQGSAAIEAGKIRYTPGAGLTDGQVDTFTYYPAHDGALPPVPGTVTVTIVEPTGTFDGDADGLPDGWELAGIGHLQEGSADNRDGDPFDNFLEYALVYDSDTNDSGSGPTARRTRDGEDHWLEYEYRRNIHAAGLTYTVMHCEDLAAPHPAIPDGVDIFENILETGENHELVQIRIRQAPGQPSGYIWLILGMGGA
jgi:hypothetical protein